ncbi:peptidylprolyl isomerase [uncultured Eudoraea sp.]|uniref:peptidylprolyl isomerase n=1 Tax=uncultured Eudoraea sp. TaxID=1035614 RepID=UPI002612D5D8|nr:peptidylprolyl isomerase [uncultured Eudoraea sp.]
MSLLRITFLAILPIFFFGSCKQSPSNNDKQDKPEAVESEPVLSDSIADPIVKEVEEDVFVLTEENAIDFFFDYQKNLKTTQVKLTTSMGSFTVELYDNVPYHKANFIYLTKKGYFDNTMFHRVVKDFIIQGGNADNKETAAKRKAIGRYLLPPDTRKGYKHHRGTISMPSSEIDNPHMLASPYEFFIVVTKPGSYHLDGDFTPFGKVVSGMDVVDNINQQPVDSGDWPMKNIYILKAEIVE